jgi:hypothetical protein
VGIKEVHDDIWLVSFINYDLGYIDLEERTLQPLDNPFGAKCNYIAGTECQLCVRVGQRKNWSGTLADFEPDYPASRVY